MKTSWKNRKVVWGSVAVALATSAVWSTFDPPRLVLVVRQGSARLHDVRLHARLRAVRLRRGAHRRHNQRLFLILAIGCVGLGVLWEVFDWVYDQLVRPNVILDKMDTILDLVADARGSLAAGYVCSRMLEK